MARILFYTHAFSGGGAELVFARLARALADASHDVIFAADHRGPADGADAPRLRHVRLGAGHARATWRLAALLRAERPDASFSALGAQNLKHVAAAILAGRRRHCVLGYHGFAAAEPRPMAQASYWASPLTTRLAARSICVSDALLDDIRNRWRGSRRRTLRIYNPLPPATPELAGSIDPERPLVLACGRLVAVKRFPDLVAAFADVRPPSARLAILGEGPARAAIEAAVARFGLQARVDLPGHVADPSPWYRRAACVVITSETESFGLTAAEALAHGVPVVATDCGGPSEILETGRCGCIVPVGDVGALASAIGDALVTPGDPAPRRRRAEAFALPTIRDAYAALTDALA